MPALGVILQQHWRTLVQTLVHTGVHWCREVHIGVHWRTLAKTLVQTAQFGQWCRVCYPGVMQASLVSGGQRRGQPFQYFNQQYHPHFNILHSLPNRSSVMMMMDTAAYIKESPDRMIRVGWHWEPNKARFLSSLTLLGGGQ